MTPYPFTVQGIGVLKPRVEKVYAPYWQRGEKDYNMNENSYIIKPIGIIHSELVNREQTPSQGYEGAPDAWLELSSTLAEGLEGINIGDEIILITWLHKADREVLKVHPRGDRNRPLSGVFATRSPDRPNPLGLHRVTVRELNGNKVKVGPLEAIEGTPIVDIKSVHRRSTDAW